MHTVETSPPLITEDELNEAIKRMMARKTSPGPDGIPSKVLAITSNILREEIKHLFDMCLIEGRFPNVWKTANLALIPKPGKSNLQAASSFRPLCLINEAGKMLEKILADRIWNHLTRIGPDISNNQFGFRRSAIDAISKVTSAARRTVAKGGIMLAVSIDIANAFNSLPWQSIKIALSRHGIPSYLRRIIEDYLSNREIVYNVGQSLPLEHRTIEKGVPQGSVLSPLLWNLGYNPIFGAAVPDGTEIIGYADDTLIMITGKSWTRTLRAMEAAIAAVVNTINKLGLQISPHKTEALWFHGLPKSKNPPESWISVSSERIRVSDSLKYLGIHQDGRLTFNTHFKKILPRIEKAQYLGRILPNTYGPGHMTRKLYANVVTSMAMYGAPIWYRFIRKEEISILKKIQRPIAIRLARAYRTSPNDLLLALTGMLPLHLTARTYDAIYQRNKKARREGLEISNNIVSKWRHQEHIKSMSYWRTELETSKERSKPILNAILKHWDKWIPDGPANLTYRVTQLMTGHGCFANYLHKIGATNTDTCMECNSLPDGPEHVLFECPALEEQRKDLASIIGSNFTYETIVSALSGAREQCSAVKNFCEQAMTTKEQNERDNERTNTSRRTRKHRRQLRRRTKQINIDPG